MNRIWGWEETKTLFSEALAFADAIGDRELEEALLRAFQRLASVRLGAGSKGAA